MVLFSAYGYQGLASQHCRAPRFNPAGCASHKLSFCAFIAFEVLCCGQSLKEGSYYDAMQCKARLDSLLLTSNAAC
jgi:hypothetical protein